MFFELSLILLLWWGWVNLSILFLIINVVGHKFIKIIFAGFWSRYCVDRYNDIADSFKIELFKELNDMKRQEKITILEIGAGSGTNFKYYNRPAIVQAVEPNRHFESFLKENGSKYPLLDVDDMKVAFGEDLMVAGIEDNSFDAVVMTLVLCSVEDQQKVYQEVRRVLKPGGKFFFMEHIADDESSTMFLIQKFLMECGLWPFVFDGCNIDRATDEEMKKAGFAKIEATRYNLPINDSQPFWFKIAMKIIRRHVMGIATKEGKEYSVTKSIEEQHTSQSPTRA